MGQGATTQIKRSANRSTAVLVTSGNHAQVDQPIVEIIQLLQKINLDDPLAKLNETTISDNNGGRIEL